MGDCKLEQCNEGIDSLEVPDDFVFTYRDVDISEIDHDRLLKLCKHLTNVSIEKREADMRNPYSGRNPF